MQRQFSTDDVAYALESIGFIRVRQRASHIRYSGEWRGQSRHVTLVAGQDPIPLGTLKSILAQASLTKAELRRLLQGEQL
jgi:predicted RNA binding protein YcfA (HicA-like mRNA interferase family)